MDLWFYRGERPSRSVSRERREPQAGAASCLSKAASKAADASGDGVSVPEPNTERTAIGEGLESLPGSKSVARAEGVARNRGGPESPCRTNCEGQAGREAQRQEVPPGTPGVGSAHSIQRQGASPEAGEGADVLAKHTQATRAVRMTDPTGKPSCARRERVNTKSPVREYRPPGSVRGSAGQLASLPRQIGRDGGHGLGFSFSAFPLQRGGVTRQAPLRRSVVELVATHPLTLYRNETDSIGHGARAVP